MCTRAKTVQWQEHSPGVLFFRQSASVLHCLESVAMKKLTGGLAILALLAHAASALAHHSFAMFDHTRTVTLKGEVTKFQWTNPHAILEIDVPGSGGPGGPVGSVTHYTLELTSINMMQRLGWRSNFIKAGDKVKAVMAPLLNGERGGLLLDITLPDGRKLEPGVPAIGTFKRTPEAE